MARVEPVEIKIAVEKKIVDSLTMLIEANQIAIKELSKEIKEIKLKLNQNEWGTTMIKVKKTSIKGRYNLIDDTKPNHDSDKYIRQLNITQVKMLGKSIINLISEEK